MNTKELIKRRKTLMRMVGPKGVAIVPSANLVPRNRDVDHVFRQDSDFLYLTGFNEPNALALLMPDKEGDRYILFCRERDADQEIWSGRRAPVWKAR